MISAICAACCGIKDTARDTNGAEALSKMQSRRFDLVLCDYNLGPGKDAPQVLEEARRRLLDLAAIDRCFGSGGPGRRSFEALEPWPG